MAVLVVMGTSPPVEQSRRRSPRRGADVGMWACCAWGGNLLSMVVALCSLCSRPVVGGALPLPAHSEGPLPCASASPGPCPRPPCLPRVQMVVGPQEPPHPHGLGGMFHCCRIPGQLQRTWTGRTVAQSLTTSLGKEEPLL